MTDGCKVDLSVIVHFFLRILTNLKVFPLFLVADCFLQSFYEATSNPKKDYISLDWMSFGSALTKSSKTL